MSKSFENTINKIGKMKLSTLSASNLDTQLSGMLHSLGIKNYDETIRVGTLLKKQNPESHKVAYVLAAAHAAAGNISEATGIYEEIINKNSFNHTPTPSEQAKLREGSAL